MVLTITQSLGDAVEALSKEQPVVIVLYETNTLLPNGLVGCKYANFDSRGINPVPKTKLFFSAGIDECLERGHGMLWARWPLGACSDLYCKRDDASHRHTMRDLNFNFNYEGSAGTGWDVEGGPFVPSNLGGHNRWAEGWAKKILACRPEHELGPEHGKYGAQCLRRLGDTLSRMWAESCANDPTMERSAPCHARTTGLLEEIAFWAERGDYNAIKNL